MAVASGAECAAIQAVLTGSRLNFKSGMRKYQRAMRPPRAAAGWVLDNSEDSIIDDLHAVPAGA
jgi:hypothetical protein